MSSSSASASASSLLHHQLQVSKAVIVSNLALITAGLIEGTQVSSMPYPKLALAAHLQFIDNGVLMILLALLLHLQVILVTNPIVLHLFHLTGYIIWATPVSEVYAAYTGAYGILKLTA